MAVGGLGRHHQGMDRPRVRQVPEGSGEQRKLVKTGCEIIFGAPATLDVKGIGELRRGGAVSYTHLTLPTRRTV